MNYKIPSPTDFSLSLDPTLTLCPQEGKGQKCPKRDQYNFSINTSYHDTLHCFYAKKVSLLLP